MNSNHEHVTATEAFAVWSLILIPCVVMFGLAGYGLWELLR
jgi:hypothetical protein